MRHAWLMPKLGLTMTEGTLSEWTVAPGARFAAGDCVFVVENDKAASEIAAERDGVMGEPLVAVGETVPVGTVLGHWEDEAGGAGEAGRAAVASAAASTPPTAEAPVHGAAQRAADASPSGAALVSADAPSLRRPVTPWARQLARRGAIELAAVAGSGPNGRVRGRDVEAALAARSAVAAAAGAPKTVRDQAVPAAPVAEPPAAPIPATFAARPAGRVEPFGSMQRVAAARLTAVKQQVPHFYLTREAEVSALLDLHARLKEPGAEPKLTLTHFLVSAVGRALRVRPELNRVWCDEGALRLDGSDVGVAVHTDRGLVVPVVREAGRLGIAALARQAHALVERARAGRLGSDEMAGGAITVSNAGMHGLTAMASIIVPGQSMILGVGGVRELFRPDANGAPALRRELVLTLSVDHRVLDGVAGASLLEAIVDALAHPARLLFD